MGKRELNKHKIYKFVIRNLRPPSLMLKGGGRPIQYDIGYVDGWNQCLDSMTARMLAQNGGLH